MSASAELPDVEALLGALEVPELEADLASFQAEAGAVFDVSELACLARLDLVVILKPGLYTHIPPDAKGYAACVLTCSYKPN